MPIESKGSRTVYGICVHTTGDGIPAQSLKENKPPLEAAREVYESMGMVGPHYVVDPFGATDTYCDPQLLRYHVGLEADQRRSFLDGNWRNDANRISPAVVSWWSALYPGVKSPSHLYPGPSANAVYIGIEVIPAGVYNGTAGWTWKWGSRPGFDQQRFSVESYRALASLVLRLADEFTLDLNKVGVLVGHESLNVYTRPGWDPGDMNHTFSWSMLRGLLTTLPKEGA